MRGRLHRRWRTLGRVGQRQPQRHRLRKRSKMSIYARSGRLGLLGTLQEGAMGGEAQDRRPTSLRASPAHVPIRSRPGWTSAGYRIARDRLSRALRGIGQWCRRNRHKSLPEQHAALSRKLRGHYAYYGITGNSSSLARFCIRDRNGGLAQTEPVGDVCLPGLRRKGLRSRKMVDFESILVAARPRMQDPLRRSVHAH